MKISVAFFLSTIFLIGCGNEEDIEQAEIEEEVSEAESQAQVDNVVVGPVRGIVRGQEFHIEQALLKNGTLTLRQGKEFFADRSVRIFIFESDSLENLIIKVNPETGFSKPHLHLGIKHENENLPDNKIVTDGYKMDLRFGKFDDLGIPFSIKLTINDETKTEIEGESFATFENVRVKDGQVDLTYDSFDTLHYVARQYLQTKHEGIQLLEDFGVSYKSYGGSNDPKVGFIGYETILEDTSPLIVKLQLFKDEKGWRVANQLAENQIHQAHPVGKYTVEDKRSERREHVEMVAAITFENYLNDHKLMPKVRSTSVRCYVSKDRDKASCRAVYGISEPNEVICKNKNYLLVRNEEEWGVGREITDTEKVDYNSGELVAYKPSSMHCD